MSLAAILGGFLELVAPRRCAACDATLEPSEDGFCGACAPLIEPLSGAEASVAALRFGGPLADAIRRFKYAGCSELAPVLASLVRERARALGAEVDAVVPVPLHPRRLRERGYDQASLLAAEIARHARLPRRLDLLRRVRDTVPQASLERPARLGNVRDAFVASPRARGLRLLVVDDVRTTGATMGEACRALLAAGALRAHSFALALADGNGSGEGTAASKK